MSEELFTEEELSEYYAKNAEAVEIARLRKIAALWRWKAKRAQAKLAKLEYDSATNDYRRIVESLEKVTK